LLPVTFRDTPVAGWSYSVTLDSEALSRWILKYRVKILLHGHMHQPFATKICRHVNPLTQDGPMHSYWVLGMGSAGVAADHLGEIACNTIGLLSFKRESAQFALIKVHPINPPQKLWDISIDL
jgi:hypothetical protein